MVDVGAKQSTTRIARARGIIKFSNNDVIRLVQENQMKKGDVLSVGRIAGIMGAKQTSQLIPLCHPLAITNISTDMTLGPAHIEVECAVKCEGKTGVEMEALVGTLTSLATVYDMCKAVDKNMEITNVRVVEKLGGKNDFKEGDCSAQKDDAQ